MSAHNTIFKVFLIMAYSNFWIADSGGTKTEWALCKEGKVVFRHTSDGLHPRYLAQRTVEDREKLCEALLLSTQSYPVYFYGAGCGRELPASQLKEELIATGFPAAIVFPDTLGACRALLGNEPGMVAILGTGSVVLEYDGTSIINRFGGFGPLIGDEGSGLHFARLVVRDYLANRIENGEQLKQLERLIGTKEVVLNQLAGNASIHWLAGVGKILAEIPLEKYHFDNLSQWLETWYSERIQYKSISVTGSYGAAQQELLRKVVETCGITLVNVAKTPMEGLINYHFRNPNK